MTSKGPSSGKGRYVFLVLVLLLLIGAVWLAGRLLLNGGESILESGPAGGAKGAHPVSGEEVWNQAVVLVEQRFGEVKGLSFPAYAKGSVKALSGGYYPTFRVESMLTYTGPEGQKVRKEFLCVITKIGAQWKLSELKPASLRNE